MCDLARQGWINSAAGNILWQELLFQYSRSAEREPLAMVQGEFVDEA